MNVIEFIGRNIPSRDWATILFVTSIILIAVIKNVFPLRFQEFTKLLISDKFTKIYKDTSNLKSGFTISMFFIQLFSFSFFIMLYLKHLGFYKMTDLIAFVLIFTFITAYILSRYLIEKIIAVTFNFEEFIEQNNLLKVTYRSYFGFILLPINIILFYNPHINQNWFFISIISLLVVANFITYLISLKIFQNLIGRKIFYFILYLCTLEIAPYYFMYYFIAKN